MSGKDKSLKHAPHYVRFSFVVCGILDYIDLNILFNSIVFVLLRFSICLSSMGTSLQKSHLDVEKDNETYSLVWLDASVNTAPENRDVQEQIRRLFDHFKTFENTTDCLQYLRNHSKQYQIILIVSGRLGQEIVPRIHRYVHVVCIYVYCMNKEKNEKWARNYSKVTIRMR